jgi:hypothetical protein
MRRSRVADWIRACLAALLLALLAIPSRAETEGGATEFDHHATGFPLEGAHVIVACESCHPRGIFVGTPRLCRDCHHQGGPIIASYKPLDHVPTAANCDECHTDRGWLGAQIDHSTVMESCVSCHNGRIAEGKPPRHIPSSNACDDCHTTRAWLPARFDHTGITAQCTSCHDGQTATGKPNNHVPTTEQCDVCHSTMGWLPASFDHSGVMGACGTCHNGTRATGKPRNHFVTSLECDTCHSTTAWTPISFMHASAAYPGDHRGNLDCVGCHTTNAQAVQWQFPAYQPDCAGCHASDFEPEHKKVDSPTVFYTVAELRDCSGACHVYTDASFTTIKERRNGEHRVSDGEF